ncbi:MAG: high-potential iron-sulfur protein [Betaproteobacteria bacterium]
MLNDPSQRRQFLKMGGTALAMIPVVAFTERAFCATNAGLRTALKYQDKPLAEKSCSNCMQFVPGASAKVPGGCKIMPGDTEISPTGYCSAWAKKA